MIQGWLFLSNIGAFLAGQTQMPDMEAFDGKRIYALFAFFVVITVSAIAVVDERLTVMSVMSEIADGPSPMPPPIPLERAV